MRCCGPLRNTRSGPSEAPAGTDNNSVTAVPRQLLQLPTPGRALLNCQKARALLGLRFRPQLLHAHCTRPVQAYSAPTNILPSSRPQHKPLAVAWRGGAPLFLMPL
ncbi:hypothetical protein NDU88_010718 [Pleurodeles waltl]|uniref:Uncharacterized protein n=1 Tax=Pleurodeles waltl TaxID=8319 RepID=A0AAV7PWU8_PLEWA|nr:hypothetical protein NDU88_010718 [Pleurodeles waltl]